MTGELPDVISRSARAAGETLSRLHRRAGGAPDDADQIGRLASRVWQANENGDVCVRFTGDDVELIAVLSRSPVVARPDPEQMIDSPLPIVLDGNRLYSFAHWQAEQTIASGLVRLARREPAWRPDEHPVPRNLHPDQLRTWPVATHRDLLLLSGGPGTGKTHTIGALVDAFRAQRPDLRVALAAPTGKATAKLAQSILADPRAADVATAISASTCHRLLGLSPTGQYEYGDRNPLPFDLVVVDECSMVDAMLASQLIAAIGPQTRLILAGDKDQLASVQAGSFFGDCMMPNPVLAPCSVILSVNFRQRESPGIVAWATAIRDDALRAGRFPEIETEQVRLVESQPAQAFERIVDNASECFIPLAERAKRVTGDDTARTLLDDCGRLGILGALRTGPFGVDSLNKAISARLLGERRAAGDWYAGRLVIVTRNAPSVGLFNGDIGLTVDDGQGNLIVLMHPEGAGHATSGAPVRRFIPLQMPPCNDAFALTIHQSQGSDFEQVLLLPAVAGHALATRASLYTAMTRAQNHLSIYAQLADLEWAAGNAEKRIGGLADRLASWTERVAPNH